MNALMMHQTKTQMLPTIDLSFSEGVQHETSDFVKIAEQSIEKVFLISNLKIPEHAELSILIADDEMLQKLNLEWRGKDSPTNVLSFPSSHMNVGNMPEALLGDIVISVDTLQREAALENKKFDDHLSHLIIHGFLHLFGYDHETEEEALQMESLETRILAELGIPDPYEN